MKKIVRTGLSVILVLLMVFHTHGLLSVKAEPTYKIIITDGKGSAHLKTADGPIVTEAAQDQTIVFVYTPSDGKELDYWQFEGGTYKGDLIIQMPGHDLTVTAVEREIIPTIKAYKVTVSGGYATNANGERADSFQEGERFFVHFNELPEDDIRTLDEWSVTPAAFNIDSQKTKMKMELIMGNSDLNFTASYKDDPEKAAKASEAAEEKEFLKFHEFLIQRNLEKIPVPNQFSLAEDGYTFTEKIQAFYNQSYNIYVYYAKRNGGFGNYVYDKMDDTLIPFVTLSVNGEKYILTTPDRKGNIPGTFRSDLSVTLSRNVAGNETTVPGYLVEDRNKSQVVLLYLVDGSAKRDFYVYESTGSSVKLTPFDKYESEHETEESSEEETEDEKSTGKAKGPSHLWLWLILIAVIIILVVVALIVVFRMSKKRDNEAEKNEFNVIDGETFDTSEYESDEESNSEIPETFNMNFENAFPEEMQVQRLESVESMQEKLHAETEKESADHNPAEDRLKIDFENSEDSSERQEERKENPEFAKTKIRTVGESEILATALKEEMGDPHQDPEVLFRCDFEAKEMNSKAPKEKEFKRPESFMSYEEATNPNVKKNAPREMLSEDDFEVIDFKKKR